MTIQELNNKWWYRLIKVLFIGINFVLIMSVFVFIMSDNKPHQESDYKLSCIADYTNKRSFYAEKDLNIYIFAYAGHTAYDDLSDSERQKIRNVCDISTEEADTATNNALSYISEQSKLGSTKNTIQDYIDNNLRPYTITSTTVEVGSYIQGILFSLLWTLIILIVAEIIRRIFYYIFLGKMRPNK